MTNDPSLDQCRRQAEALCEIVQDFPFATKQDVSAWMAGLLTCVARPAIEGPCPLFAIDASTHGVGKTLLATATSRLAFDRDPVVISPPADEGEFEKLIAMLAREAVPLCLLDGVSKTLASDALAQALTSERWRARTSGASRTWTLPLRTVWWAVGCNLKLAPDIARRTIRIRLGSSEVAGPASGGGEAVAGPVSRSGLGHAHLIEWVVRERPRLVAAAATMVRGYVAAGAPGAATWGGFESWSKLIPGILPWLGRADPMAWQLKSWRV